MRNRFVISDTHFGHANIMGYCQRPFATVEEMDEAMIANWNAVVRPQDKVYHLGDVAIKRESLSKVRRLNGHKYLIAGNHDIFDVRDYLDAGFEKVMGVKVFDGVIFTHIPLHPVSVERFKANVHGHIHNSPSYGFPHINVSVEVVNYTPVPMESILSTIEQSSSATAVVEA